MRRFDCIGYPTKNEVFEYAVSMVAKNLWSVQMVCAHNVSDFGFRIGAPSKSVSKAEPTSQNSGISWVE